MSRTSNPVWLPALGGLLSCALLAQPARIVRPIDNARVEAIAGSVHPKVQARYDQGPEDSARTMPYISLTLKPTDAQQADLDKLLAEQQDRGSPHFHGWLSPEQFGERFGIAPADYAAVAGWIESEGLHIERQARARNFIAFSGSVAQVESAFHTKIHRYQINGESYYGNATEISVPEALRDLYGGIHGLNDFGRPHAARKPENTGPSGIQMAPADWAIIYDVNPLYAMGIDGSGVRIGILGAYDMNQSYIDGFRQMFGLPATQVEQHLVGNDPGVTSSSNEAALDLEWSGAIAPKATLVYIYGANFNIAAQAAIDQNLANVLSQSFGTCEPNSGLGNRIMAQQAAAQGITWVASSGDSGGSSCDPHGFFGSTAPYTPVSDGLAVDIPASFPEVTAVGGTMFNEDGAEYWHATNDANGASAFSYIPEKAWNDSTGGGPLASGGGASIFYPKPAWQSAPGVPDDNARDIPDLSFSASGNHDPYMVVNSAGQRGSGGTSASAPSFAGVVALLNQYVVKNGAQQQPGLGNINPELYRLARTTTNVFHDITTGDTRIPCTTGSPSCDNGLIGFVAGPGYDLATGLGSLDVANFVTQWANAASPTTTALTATPASITLGDTAQLTATISPATPGPAAPGGTITFTVGRTLLGVAPVTGGRATLTVSSPSIPAGTPAVAAAYSGDANYGGSVGTAVMTVTGSSTGSLVTVSITPNPAHEGQFVRVTLAEQAGVGTTVTGWTINGADDFSLFVNDFGSTTLPPHGTLWSGIGTATPAVLPSNRVYAFTGKDADGRQWTAEATLVLEGPLGTPDLRMTSVPSTVAQNPAADSSCQWSQQLIVQEQLGFAVTLTRLKAGSADWTNQIQQLFGTTRLAPLGLLQAHICWPGPAAPPAITFELDGVDQGGSPVTAAFSTAFSGPLQNPGTLSAASNVVTLSQAVPSATLNVSLAGGGSATASVLPANRSTSWLTVSGTPPQITVKASASGLTPGVYSATVLIQSQTAVPSFVEVPVVLTVGNAAVTIGGVSNGASFQQAFAPGMILSVFGSQLAPSAQSAAGVPLPSSLAGVSATVNGVAAPLYFVSPGQINLQVPYETGVGTAVLGINNGGSVGSFTFPMSPAGPGVFTDPNHAGALLPIASAKHGDTILAFVTGDGLVSTSLGTGASPFQATPLDLLPAPMLPVSVTVGGVAAKIAFAGIPPGLAGATQINFVIPDAAPSGVQPVLVTVGGIASQPAMVTITP